MRLGLDREWLWGAAAVVVLGLLWSLDPGGSATRVRERAFEVFGQVFPRAATNDVVVVDIDRESLSRLGPWPWRRSVVADLIDKAAAHQPGSIAIDILLSGSDRRGPAALARMLAEASGRTDLPGMFDDDDRRLAEAISRAGNVALGLVLDEEGRDIAPIAVPVSAEAGIQGILPRSSSGLIGPFEPLAAGAAGIGVLSFQEGVVGRVTGAPVLAMAAGEVFPGLALEAVRIAERAPLLALKGDPNRLVAGRLEVPMDARAEMRLHFGPPSAWSARTIPAWSLLADPARHAAIIAGRLVLIGSSAPEAGAFLPVAGSPLMPTVQIQAETVEQIIAGRFLLRPNLALAWELGAMLLLGLGGGVLAARLAPGWAAVATLVLIAGWLTLTAVLFVRLGLLIDPAGPAVALAIGANATALAAFIRTRAMKTAILHRFERYVAPEVVARLLSDPGRLKLDGELREVTALLTDVEGFSRMTENSNPRTLVGVLDAYFDCVTELVIDHGGMVDKIVGDAVLAFFNIPDPLPRHAVAGVRCAQAIVAATEAFRGRSDAAAIGFGRTRCGVESGIAIVGDVGGSRRLDYTAYGAVVNKAARFEEANKVLRSSLCIGPATAGMLGGEIPLRSLGEIAVRGMQGRSRLFEPWPQDVPAEARALYEDAVAAETSDPERARRLFREFAALRPDDLVVKAWLERLDTAVEAGASA